MTPSAFAHGPVTPPVLVIGATGQIGRYVVDELLRLGAPVRALTRRPDAAALPDRVEIAAGDLTDAASLEVALRGVDAVFLLWTAPVATAADVIARLAEEAPSRVVYLSAPHRTPHPFFQQPNSLRSMHVEIERLLAASGLATTIVRPGMFTSNALHWWAPQLRDGNVVRWPYADVETAPIHVRDIAAVVARTLVDDRHVGGDYVLTGPEALSHSAQVRAIGDAIGRAIRFEELTPDEFRRETAGSWPAPAVEMLLAAWSAAAGHPAFVTSTVAEITGGQARSFGDWAAEHASMFARPAANGDTAAPRPSVE
jgi:uncharacterized protein YbjT (DUF2867 family)